MRRKARNNESLRLQPRIPQKCLQFCIKVHTTSLGGRGAHYGLLWEETNCLLGLTYLLKYQDAKQHLKNYLWLWLQLGKKTHKVILDRYLWPWEAVIERKGDVKHPLVGFTATVYPHTTWNTHASTNERTHAHKAHSSSVSPRLASLWHYLIAWALPLPLRSASSAHRSITCICLALIGKL